MNGIVSSQCMLNSYVVSSQYWFYNDIRYDAVATAHVEGSLGVTILGVHKDSNWNSTHWRRNDTSVSATSCHLLYSKNMI